MDPKVYHLTIYGRPVSQKNTKEIAFNRKTKRPMIVSNKKVKQWRKEAKKALQSQWGERAPLTGEVGLLVISYRHPRQRIDADSLLPAPMDALQEAGVVKNDNQLEPVISLRRMDRDYPRVEMWLFDPAEELREMLDEILATALYSRPASWARFMAINALTNPFELKAQPARRSRRLTQQQLAKIEEVLRSGPGASPVGDVSTKDTSGLPTKTSLR